MQILHISSTAAAVMFMAAGVSTTAQAAAAAQVGASGKSFATAEVQCAVHPVTGQSAPTVQAGLLNPVHQAEATLRLNGVKLKELKAASPVADVWLADGNNTVTVQFSKRVTDTYLYPVTSGQCSPAPSPGNFFSADGTLEYAVSGKSYLTVDAGCALNPATGQTQPYVNLFDNGSFLLNVSLNAVPLTQLSALRPRALVFLSAGVNVITAANGALSTDRYTRDGGTGTCTLP